MPHSGTALLDPYRVFDKITLTAGRRVADLGCGRTGHFVFPAARTVGDTGVVYAVDIMKDVLENIKSRVRSEGYDNVQVIWSDIEKIGKLPIPEKSLDACFFVNVMFLLKAKTEALKEAARLLKDDGRLVVVDWLKKIGPLGPDANLMVAPEAMESAAAAVGLKKTERINFDDHHYCLIFKKG